MTAADAVDVGRLSLNQITIDQWTLEEAAAACGEAGIRWIAPWREKVASLGVERAARILDEAGVRVSSLCRGGFFTDENRQERRRDNRRAIEEAAALGTDVLVLVCGPPADRDLSRARAAIATGIEELVPHAAEHGVRLGVEPLHPMMIAERSAIASLAEALDLVERLDVDTVGVVLDVYHLFWDAGIETQIARAFGRIVGFHVSDWTTPSGDVLSSRRLPGDGIIDIRRLRSLVDETGYDGPIEVEVINQGHRTLPGHDLLRDVVERFERYV